MRSGVGGDAGLRRNEKAPQMRCEKIREFAAKRQYLCAWPSVSKLPPLSSRVRTHAYAARRICFPDSARGIGNKKKDEHRSVRLFLLVSQRQGKSNFQNGNFSETEYTLTCRLRASSTRSVWRMRTHIRGAAHPEWVRARSASPKQKDTHKECLREFRAKHEYTHTLRLESKLSDLRVGYANPYSKRYAF